jgi:hypothetical protein
LPVFVGVPVVTKDVENDHPDEPHQPQKQRPFNCLCHGRVSLHPVWFIWFLSFIWFVWFIWFLWFNRLVRFNPKTRQTKQTK